MGSSEHRPLAMLSLDELLMGRRSIRRNFLERKDLQPINIAVLGGATTTELVKLLDVFLLESGFLPTFHESEFGRFYIDSVLDTNALVAFQPDVVYLHTSVLDLQRFAPIGSTRQEFVTAVESEASRFREIWNSLEAKLGCIVIQNNFEFPPYAILGNLDATDTSGHTRFVSEINRLFAHVAEETPKLLLQDVCSLSARLGLGSWFDPERWFSYKLATTLAASRELAVSLTAILRGIYGKTRKVLVLDLDNTLWGGVIGDDGPDKIQIGRETPIAEAYTAFQEYCLSLRHRGILLAVCSKNNDEIARQGFTHPDSVLKLSDISSFQANWDPKHVNVAAIARELNLGVDSFVFVDDNPAEREIVRGQVEGIAVPEIGDDVVKYAELIETGRYFEQVSLSTEDIGRATLYQENAQRVSFQQKFPDYHAYLDSLEMVAEIGSFNPVYTQRIAQLTNKTNQFNLTTRRYTLAQIEAIAADPMFLGLYCKLSDRFGDHGLISVVLGQQKGNKLHMDLWLMSCRVLKRDVEQAMLDSIVERATARGIRTVYGHYLPTAKNGMVADLYPRLGFAPSAAPPDVVLPEGTSDWALSLDDYTQQNKHIKIKEFVNG